MEDRPPPQETSELALVSWVRTGLVQTNIGKSFQSQTLAIAKRERTTSFVEMNWIPTLGTLLPSVHTEFVCSKRPHSSSGGHTHLESCQKCWALFFTHVTTGALVQYPRPVVKVNKEQNTSGVLIQPEFRW